MRFLSPLVATLMALAVACSGDSGSSDASPTVTRPAATAESTAVPTTAAAGAASVTPAPSATPQATDTPEPTAPAATATAAPAPTSPPQPTSPPAPASPSAPAGVPAPIKGYGFPYQLTVPTGSTVVWTNYDSVPHDVTANDDSWTSGLFSEGESYARTFNSPGRYAYVCRVHPYMTAVLIVE